MAYYRHVGITMSTAKNDIRSNPGRQSVKVWPGFPDDVTGVRHTMYKSGAKISNLFQLRVSSGSCSPFLPLVVFLQLFKQIVECNVLFWSSANYIGTSCKSFFYLIVIHHNLCPWCSQDNLHLPSCLYCWFVYVCGRALSSLLFCLASLCACLPEDAHEL